MSFSSQIFDRLLDIAPSRVLSQNGAHHHLKRRLGRPPPSRAVVPTQGPVNFHQCPPGRLTQRQGGRSQCVHTWCPAESGGFEKEQSHSLLWKARAQTGSSRVPKSSILS